MVATIQIPDLDNIPRGGLSPILETIIFIKLSILEC